MMRSMAIGVALLAMSGCRITDVVNTLTVSGTVVAAADGAGYTAGQPIDGAAVSLWYAPPLQISSTLRDTDTTPTDGAFRLESGPPPGQNEPLCSTLSISVVKVGFQTPTVRLSSRCAGAGVLEDLQIELVPN